MPKGSPGAEAIGTRVLIRVVIADGVMSIDFEGASSSGWQPDVPSKTVFETAVPVQYVIKPTPLRTTFCDMLVPVFSAESTKIKVGGRSMRREFFAAAFLGAAALIAMSVPANAQKFSGKFSGFNELGGLNAETGAILSEGKGTIELDVDKSSQTITYTLTYSGLTSPVLQSHIHFGRIHTPGGIFVFLCTNLGNGPTGTPTCPNPGGTVTGTITAASVLAVPGQNITAGDFDAVIDILSAHAAYANIHTNNFKAGEIRAELRRERKHDGDSQNQ